MHALIFFLNLVFFRVCNFALRINRLQQESGGMDRRKEFTFIDF